MKIFKVDSQSWKQMDDRTTRPQIAMHTGIHDLTAVNIKNKSLDERVEIEAEAIANERKHQLQHDKENNKYSANIENQTNIGAVNEHDKKTAHIDPSVGEYIENGQSTTFSATGGSADNADADDEDYMYEMSIPGTNKKLYIYSKQQHKDLQGGLIIPEDSDNSNKNENEPCIATQGAGVSFEDTASGVAFEENASGIAFNQTQLDNALNSLENSKGGAIPAIVGELAVQLIPQIPAIISAIKSKRDDVKVGKGLSNAMATNKLVSNLYSALPTGRQASFYNDMIKEFNGLKRVGSGLQVHEGEYYASGKITDSLKKFFGWVKRGYENNKELFAPIRDSLLNAATASITSGVNKATDKLTETVAKKTNNEHLNNIAKAVSDVGKTVGDKVNEHIEASVLA